MISQALINFVYNVTMPVERTSFAKFGGRKHMVMTAGSE